MFKKIVTILVALPVAAFAAEGGGSEFFHQAQEGKHELTPSFTYLTGSYETPGTTADMTGTTFSLSYDYGLMPEMSLGAELAFSSTETEVGAVSSTDSGLNDLALFVKASMPAGPGALKYGAELSLSPGDSVSEASGDANNYSGGHALTPYVGYEYNAAPCTFGAKLATSFGLTDRATEDESTTPSTKTDYSGSEETTFSFFYEHEFNADMLIGASLDWTTTSDETDETNGGTSENVSPTQVLSVYLPTKLGEGVLLPTLSYMMTTADQVNNTDIDSYSFTQLAVGYRMMF